MPLFQPADRSTVRDRLIAVGWWLWWFNAAGGWIHDDLGALALALPLVEDYELGMTIWHPTPSVLITIWLQSAAESRRLASVELSPLMLLVLAGLVCVIVQRWTQRTEEP
ncbi:MAG: hypothetical protein NVS2B7_31540 [Herpetosiphon sp.]